MTTRELEGVLLGRNIEKISEIGPLPFLLIMLASLGTAFLCSFFYVKFYAGRSTGSQIHRAFPLLGVSITAIFICVQFSLALSLGLLGALSIVRFRNPIKEPEEIGFLMLVIASSIACATFNILFLVLLLVVAFVGLWIVNRGPSFLRLASGTGSLVIRMAQADYKSRQAELLALIARLAPKARVESVSVDDETCLLTYAFPALNSDAFLSLEREISALVPNVSMNVFFSRSEALL